MSVIANFKKRQLKKQAEQKSQIDKAVDKTAGDQSSTEPKNEALTLLAKLLNVAEQDAISEATKYVESDITFFMRDENAEAQKGGGGVKTLTGEETPESEDALNQAASDVEASAENVNNAASNVEDAASDLAGTASDIANATEELKEAAAEVKKPSEGAQKSSNGESKGKQKSNSKK